MTINEIKELLINDRLNETELAELENDSRAGVKKLLDSYRRRKEKLAQKRDSFEKRFTYEKTFWAKNQMVAGVDEVGRGPLAGPVVTAAVIIDENFDLIDVNDSKKLRDRKSVV